MGNFNIIRIIAISLIFAFISCGKNLDITLEKEYEGVDVELWSYFEKFEIEASKRDLNVDLVASGITGTIEKIHTYGMVGMCNHRMDKPNHVIIDIDFWQTASNNTKEMIVFHELGHCYLTRGHKDERKNNGTCASIMRSGKAACMDFYTSDNRKEYLDELFDMEG